MTGLFNNINNSVAGSFYTDLIDNMLVFPRHINLNVILTLLTT